MKNKFEALANNAEWSEKAVERYLVRRMEEVGGVALKYTNDRHTGYPDRICLFPNGVTVFVEVKGKKGILSDMQEMRITFLKDINHYAAVCRSKEEVDKLVNLFKDIFVVTSGPYDL